MKTISRWASHHACLAIGLLVSCEVINGYNGVLLGANSLTNCPRWPIGLTLLILTAGGVGLRWWATPRFGRLTYDRQRWLLLLAFGLNFLLFVGVGGWWSTPVTSSASPVLALSSRRAAMRADTVITPDAQLRSTAPGSTTAPSPGATDRQTGKRVTYVLLAILGIVICLFSAGLACNIACSGHGFAAAITLLLGLGFSAGSIYLLARLRERPILPLRELPLASRRRILGRFWKAWLILIGVFAVLSLL